MKPLKMTTLAYMKEYYGIPCAKKVQWVLVDETTSTSSELRLGLGIVDTNLYVDLATRRFYTAGCIGSVNRKVYPAHKRTSEEGITFIAVSDPNITKTIPLTYIEDIYYPTRFMKEFLMEDLF